jgi:hypothetical protein
LVKNQLYCETPPRLLPVDEEIRRDADLETVALVCSHFPLKDDDVMTI